MSSRAQDVAGRPLTRDLQSVIDDGTKHAAAFAAMIVPSLFHDLARQAMDSLDAINHALVQRGPLPPFTVTSR
jgi:hypothetical protein